MNDLYTLQKKLSDHLKAKPQYPLYGETSLEEHIEFGKVFATWDKERERLEMLILLRSPKQTVTWAGALRTNGYHETLHRPKGIAADPQKSRWAKCEPRDDAHKRRLEQQARYREKKKRKQQEAQHER